MKNNTQLDRYKRLLNYLDAHFKDEVNIDKIEEITFYSYRNINRIFLALQYETIGQYVKRVRLEKAAEYLKFSDENLADIAYDIGYSDIAAFSKAFKAHFNCSPYSFRESSKVLQEIINSTIKTDQSANNALEFVIEELPELSILYLTYQGPYTNVQGMKNTWEQLINYALQNRLIDDNSIILGEVLDDNEITETLNCRYNTAIVLKNELQFIPEGLFRTKTIPAHKYAKFVHKGSHESCMDTYDLIYANWMTNVNLEFEDLPTLEFYLNDEEDTPPEDLLTEIYIPVK